MKPGSPLIISGDFADIENHVVSDFSKGTWSGHYHSGRPEIEVIEPAPFIPLRLADVFDGFPHIVLKGQSRTTYPIVYPNHEERLRKAISDADNS